MELTWIRFNRLRTEVGTVLILNAQLKSFFIADLQLCSIHRAPTGLKGLTILDEITRNCLSNIGASS